MAQKDAVSQAEAVTSNLTAEKSSKAVSPADVAGSSRSTHKNGSADKRESAAPKSLLKQAGTGAAAGANGKPVRAEKEEPAGENISRHSRLPWTAVLHVRVSAPALSGKLGFRRKMR